MTMSTKHQARIQQILGVLWLLIGLLDLLLGHVTFGVLFLGLGAASIAVARLTRGRGRT